MTNPADMIITTVVALWDLLVFILMSLYFYGEAIFRLFIKPPKKSLSGEIILITGAAKGIGREVCLLLSKSNAKLVCWDLDQSANENLVKQLKEFGCDAYSYVVDVSNRSQVEATAAQVKRTVGDVTVLINNAGIMPCKQFLKHSPEELERTFQINVFGNFWTLRVFLPQMIINDKGHIVTLCSAAGLVPTRNLAPYCGTKHAIHGFIEGLKDEMRHMAKVPNIQFTTVYPYSCDTGLLSGIRSNSRFPWLVTTVLKPEDVAMKLVEGLVRNYEHVYIPGFVQSAGVMAKALIPKVQYAAADFVQCYVEPTTDS